MERAKAKDDPVHARGRKWWRTHERPHQACFRLVRLNRNGMLFAFRDPGVDADVKRTLDYHRGPSEART